MELEHQGIGQGALVDIQRGGPTGKLEQLALRLGHRPFQSPSAVSLLPLFLLPYLGRRPLSHPPLAITRLKSARSKLMFFSCITWLYWRISRQSQFLMYTPRHSQCLSIIQSIPISSSSQRPFFHSLRPG